MDFSLTVNTEYSDGRSVVSRVRVVGGELGNVEVATIPPAESDDTSGVADSGNVAIANAVRSGFTEDGYFYTVSHNPEGLVYTIHYDITLPAGEVHAAGEDLFL